MLRADHRNTAAMIVLAAATLAASSAFAEKASLHSISYNPGDAVGVIRVISTDKKTWNAIQNGSVWFEAGMHINTKHPGAVMQVAVTLGECSGGGGSCGPALWSADVGERDYDHTASVVLSTSKLGVSGTGITLGDQIIAGCNAKLQADGPTKSHSFVHELPSSFIADTEKVWGNVDKEPIEAGDGSWPAYPNQNDHHRTEMVKVQIVCDPVVKPATNDVSFGHGAFKVEDVKLFLTTYQNTQAGSNPGTVCPAFKVSTRAETSKAGPVSMRVWRQKNGGAITSELVQAWAGYDAAKNGYFANWHKFEQVGTTSTFQYMVEIEGQGSFAPTDGWKDITVHCTGAGGGGFADQPKDNPDLPKPQASWAGELIVADSAGADKSCPRKGQVFFSVTRAEPGNFDYRISCSNGAYFEGTAIGYDQGSGVFEAYGAHDLSVNKTRSIQCTLQEMTPAPVTVAVDKTDFTCANPAIDPQADDLVDAPRPNPNLVKPGKLVAPLPEPKKPRVSILCKPGYKLVGEKCVKKPAIAAACRANEIRIDGKCVKKPTVSILCKAGYKLVGEKCVKKPVIATACRADEKLVRGNCVKKPAKPAKLILPGAAKKKVKRAG